MKKILSMIIMAIGFIAFGRAPVGNDTIWGDFVAGGTCKDGVEVLANGESLSILLNDFNVYMPQGSKGDGLSVKKTCAVRIKVTPPNGYYLAKLRQVYSGGLIKSRGSSARLNIVYNLGSIMGRPLPLVWTEHQVIRPEDANSLFSKTYENNFLVANCGYSTVYGINMTLLATRQSERTQHVVGGVDTIDTDLLQRLVLIPEFALCR